MNEDVNTLKKIYHKIIEKEYENYKKRKELSSIYLTKNELRDIFTNNNFSLDFLSNLLEMGYLLQLDEDKFRSLHMDIAVRAAYGIKPLPTSPARILEKEIKIVKEPMLPRDFVKFLDFRNEPFLQLRKLVVEFLNDEELADKFFKAFVNAGISGLSEYQYKSIVAILSSSKKYALVSAPTGFGKTYVYLFIVLLDVLRRVNNNEDGVKVVMFYPRKSLEADQMSDIIKVLYHLNLILERKIKVGIMDRNTLWSSNTKEGEYRGITVKNLGKLFVIRDKNNKIKIVAKNDSDIDIIIDWILPTREEIFNSPPDILITNIWSYAYALINPKRWKSKYVNELTSWFVFDEIHVFRDNVAGVLRYIFRILENEVAPKARFILSSATIPSKETFLKDLGVGDYLDLTFNPSDYSVSDYKLNIYLLLALRPDASWETFVHELGVFLTTMSTLRRLSNENPVQSIVFIDSVREIDRIRSQTAEAIKMGKLRFHFFEDSKLINPYNFRVYYKAKKQLQIEKLEQIVLSRVDYHYSDRQDRHRVEENLKTGKVDVVYATSTLELGVNYDNVSIVVNVGIPFSLESIVQRMGRAGRNLEKTLNTALGITLIRPTPSEYYYAYRGLDYILNFENMKKISVSYNNHFVILFSALLYTLVKGAKERKEYRVKSNELNKIAELAKRIWDDYFSNRRNILTTLKVSEDFIANKTQIEKMIGALIEFLGKYDIIVISNKCSCERVRVRLKDGLARMKGMHIDIQAQIKTVEELLNNLLKIDEVKNNNLLLESIEKVKQSADTIKDLLQKLESKILADSLIEAVLGGREYGDELIGEIHKLGGRLSKLLRLLRRTLPEDTLSKYEEEVKSLRERITELEKLLRDTVTNYLARFEEDVLENKASEIRPFVCEIIKQLENLTNGEESWKVNGLSVVEALLGIKFLGNEFLDKEVNTGVWIPKGENGKEYGKKDLGTVSLSTLLYRAPPFEVGNISWDEPDQVKITDVLGGRYTWLLQPKDGVVQILCKGCEEEELKKSLLINSIAMGVSEPAGPFYDVERVDFIDLVSLSKPVLIRIPLPNDPEKELYIKYGSGIISQEKIDDKYHIYKNIRNLRGGKWKDRAFNYVLERTISTLKDIDKKLKASGDKWGINLNYIRYCKKGRAISTDPYDKDCPLKQFSGTFCPYHRLSSTEPCKFWEKQKRRIFPKVYVRKNVLVPSTLEKSVFSKNEEGVIAFFTVPYYDISENPIHFVYDEVTIYVPISPIDSVQKTFKITPIGYDAITSMIVLSFNKTFLETIIRAIFIDDKETLDAIIYKYYLYNKVRSLGWFSLNINTFKEFKEFKRSIMSIDWGDFTNSSEEIRKFLNFSIKVLLHSIAHKFLLYISDKYRAGLGKLLYRIDSEKCRIYVVENSKNDGIGIVETFRNELENRGARAILKEFLQEILRFHEKHDKQVEMEMLEFSLEARIGIESGSKTVQRLLQKIEEFNEKLVKTGVKPEKMDYVTYRLLLRWISIPDEAGEILGDVLDYLKTPHMCYDGCNLCLYFDRECSEGFSQQYTLSKRLLLAFVRNMLKGCINLENIKGFGVLLRALFESAEAISMDVAYVDEKGIELLKELTKNARPGTIFLNTTGNKLDNSINKQLKELSINVNFIQGGYHKKVYTIIYPKRSPIYSITISGSPNLTKNSLEKNKENITLLIELG